LAQLKRSAIVGKSVRGHRVAFQGAQPAPIAHELAGICSVQIGGVRNAWSLGISKSSPFRGRNLSVYYIQLHESMQREREERALTLTLHFPPSVKIRSYTLNK
jgi:hypothetical protein